MKKLLGFVAVAALVSGCGGGGGGGPYTDQFVALNALANELSNQGLDTTTPVAQIPTTGAPTYNGYVLAGTPSESYTGDLTMNADFATSMIGGSVSNMHDSAERAVAGTLTINSATINRTANPLTEFQIVTTMTGAVTDADGVVLNVSTGINGDFGGPNAEAVGIIDDGTGTMTSTAYGVELFGIAGVARQ